MLQQQATLGEEGLVWHRDTDVHCLALSPFWYNHFFLTTVHHLGSLPQRPKARGVVHGPTTEQGPPGVSVGVRILCELTQAPCFGNLGRKLKATDEPPRQRSESQG
ncbi:hypothetical protein GE21DRAFT_2836 [Neurospora crassa]|uniref:Uncharacterized protein n=1 Tax=Neurospora crassa (strain ATCC 24698 / 74-OR23-1A / CBS 708.71 / DSM 1257 / FGSC 987) TaxID=367110 RepID=Q7RW37_NEUCR|nr:hypothetical protein NCU03420 [Neurospora crassa OR74A]EAA26561.3 hypothetical protein NCU03420 [Neurospora crassa OR74A]KHE86387.1 hypothetical protein GE21DRAFT_2836 [Neurospora crassa]|eukprot:XP_955797.3 hypothetical protein NCU03420 [Neurospora crassa OR74A]